MITEVDLSGTPCFATNARLSDLKAVNFIFGPNGSGKTTLSNIFQNPNNPRLQWEDHTVGTTYVFNRDFTANALASSARLPGVFFIGKGAVTTQQTITTLEKRIKSEREALKQADKEHEDSKLDAARIRDRLNDTSWEFKKKIDNQNLANCLRGSIGSKAAFTEMLLSISSNAGEKMTLDSLSTRADQLYASDLAPISIPSLTWKPETDADTLETLLATAITSSSESKLLALIQQYNLFDWIAEGHNICTRAELKGLCPYCQQKISNAIETELEALFDKTYKQAKRAIVELADKFDRDYDSLKRLSQTLKADSKLVAKLETQLEDFDTKILQLDAINACIKRKLEHPSQEILLPLPLKELQLHIITTLQHFKDAYEQHNEVANNLSAEKLNLCNDLWSWLSTNALSTAISQYKSEIAHAHELIDKTRKALDFYEDAVIATQKEIDHHIRQLQNSKEAMEIINSMLQDLGFTSFKLSYDTSTKGYRIIRPNCFNPTCDIETLSEGEKTILTFLYFILRINDSATWPIRREPTVVIDDPIASTDAQSFFLVTQFIRRITQYLKNENKCPQLFKISQLIVCTHNTRFLSEASYDCTSGNKEKDPYAYFFRLEKHSNGTTVSEGTHLNYIDTEYNLLWNEIKTCTDRYSKSLNGDPAPDFPLLGNTMRRIIESYSKMLGTGGITKLSKHASIAVSTLVAFCNSTSHSAIDADLHSSYTLSTSQLLDAFRQFFEIEFENGAHFPHYCAMMGINLAQQGWTYPPTNKP